jgi:hypothetical protein
LVQLVETSGIRGRWQPDGEGLRFTTPDGAILIWYGRIIRLVIFRGEESARLKLHEALAHHFGGAPG